jgi:hypothetical protein
MKAGVRSHTAFGAGSGVYSPAVTAYGSSVEGGSTMYGSALYGTGRSSRALVGAPAAGSGITVIQEDSAEAGSDAGSKGAPGAGARRQVPSTRTGGQAAVAAKSPQRAVRMSEQAGGDARNGATGGGGEQVDRLDGRASSVASKRSMGARMITRLRRVVYDQHQPLLPGLRLLRGVGFALMVLATALAVGIAAFNDQRFSAYRGDMAKRAEAMVLLDAGADMVHMSRMLLLENLAWVPHAAADVAKSRSELTASVATFIAAHQDLYEYASAVGHAEVYTAADIPVPVYATVNGQLTTAARDMSLLEAGAAFVTAAQAVAAAPLAAVVEDMPAFRFVTANGISGGPLHDAFNASAYKWYDYSRDSSDSVASASAAMYAGMSALLAVIAFLVFLPILVSVERTKDRILARFVHLPLPITTRLRGITERRLRSIQRVEEEEDDDDGDGGGSTDRDDDDDEAGGGMGGEGGSQISLDENTDWAALMVQPAAGKPGGAPRGADAAAASQLRARSPSHGGVTPGGSERGTAADGGTSGPSQRPSLMGLRSAIRPVVAGGSHAGSVVVNVDATSTDPAHTAPSGGPDGDVPRGAVGWAVPSENSGAGARAAPGSVTPSVDGPSASVPSGAGGRYRVRKGAQRRTILEHARRYRKGPGSLLLLLSRFLLPLVALFAFFTALYLTSMSVLADTRVASAVATQAHTRAALTIESSLVLTRALRTVGSPTDPLVQSRVGDVAGILDSLRYFHSLLTFGAPVDPRVALASRGAVGDSPVLNAEDNDAVRDALFGDACAFLEARAGARLPSEFTYDACAAFEGGLVARGLHGLTQEYEARIELLAERRAAATVTDAVTGVGTRVAPGNVTVDYSIPDELAAADAFVIAAAELYLAPGFVTISALYSGAGERDVATLLTTQITLVAVFVLAFAVGMLLAYFPQLRVVDRDIHRQRAMLLLLPAQVMSDCAPIRDLVEDILASSAGNGLDGGGGGGVGGGGAKLSARSR